MGDIIIMGETGAQILVAAELVDHFEQSLTQVQRSFRLLMSWVISGNPKSVRYT